MMTRRGATFRNCVSACAALTIATCSGVVAARAQSAAYLEQIDGKLDAIFADYRSKFVRQSDRLKAKDPARTEQMAEFCARIDGHGKFADPDIGLAEKLQEVPRVVGQLIKSAADQADKRKIQNIITNCRIVSLANENYWSGAVYSVLFSETGKRTENDLAAAYFGSGILGARDLGLARRHLRIDNPDSNAGLIMLIDQYLLHAAIEAEDKPAIAKELDAIFDADYAALEKAAKSRQSTAEFFQLEDLGYEYEGLIETGSACPTDSGVANTAASQASEYDKRVQRIAEAAKVAAKAAGDGLSDCVEEALGGRRPWSALVYAVDDAGSARSARTAATLYGSGVLGQRDRERARDVLKRYVTLADDEERIAHAQGKIAAIDAMLGADTEPDDVAYILAELHRSEVARHHGRSVLERLNLTFDRMWANELALDQEVREHWIKELGREKYDAVATACKAIETYDPDFSERQIRSKFNILRNRVMTHYASRDESLSRAYCPEIIMETEGPWSALLYARTHVDLQGVDNFNGMVANLYGSGVLGARDYDDARRYLKKAAASAKGEGKHALEQIVAMIDEVGASGLDLFVLEEAEAAKARDAEGKKIEEAFASDLQEVREASEREHQGTLKDRGGAYIEERIGRCPAASALDPAFSGGNFRRTISAFDKTRQKASREVHEAGLSAGDLAVCANAYFQKEDYWSALLYWTVRAEFQKPTSAYRAATLYASGLLGIRDYGAVRRWLTVALAGFEEGAAHKTKRLIRRINNYEEADGKMFLAAR
jgi:hypothetical protein